MSVPFQSQVNRIRTLPRAAQFGIIAIVVLVGWLLCRDTVWAWAGRLSDEAGEMRELLERGREQADRRLPAAKDSVVAHGPVQPPRRADEGSARLSRAAEEILRANEGVGANYSFQPGSIGPIPQSALRDAIRPNQRAQRTSAEITFDAAPDVVSKVVAELEASPDIDGIKSLRLQRLDPASRKLRVRMTIEAWVIAADAPTRSMS